MTTRGIQYLREKKIAHESMAYPHQQKGAAYAAKVLGYRLAHTIKTLVVALDGKAYALVLMPGDREISMKKLARAAGVKKAAMADRATAERLTGYSVGGISPFGTRRQLPVFMDEKVASVEEIIINAGQRGLMIKMAPRDIVSSLAAKVAPLT